MKKKTNKTNRASDLGRNRCIEVDMLKVFTATPNERWQMLALVETKTISDTTAMCPFLDFYETACIRSIQIAQYVVYLYWNDHMKWYTKEEIAQIDWWWIE